MLEGFFLPLQENQKAICAESGNPLPALCHKTEGLGAVKQSSRIPVPLALLLCKNNAITLHEGMTYGGQKLLQVTHLTMFGEEV